MRRFLVPAAVLVATSAVIAGCVSSAEEDPPASTDTAVASGSGDAAPSDSPASAEPDGEPVVIGIVQAASGFMGPIDTPARNALLLEAEAINAAGGIDGSPIEIEFIDTETNLDRYASAAQELIDAGAKVLVVTCDYDVSSPAALVAETANILSIAPCVGDPIYGPAGGLDIGFSAGSGTPGESTIMAEYSFEQGWTNAVLLRDNSIKYTQNQCEIFATRFTELGGTVAATYDYTQGDSVRETVSQIAAGAAPDVVVNCGYNPGGGAVAKEIRDGGVSAPIISGFGMDGDFWVGAVPGLSDYYVVTYASKNGDDPDPAVNEAAAAYKAEYGSAPDVGGFVTGATTLQIIQAAYEEAGTWEGDQLAAAIEGFTDLPTLAGPSSFSADLHINVERPMRVLVVEDGALTFVEQRTPAKVTNVG